MHAAAITLLACLLPADKAPARTAAHPISITEADVYVTRSRATMRLSMFAEDLYLFHDIEPNELDILEPLQLQQAVEDHKEFLRERVILRNTHGERVDGRLINVEQFEIPPEGIEVANLMNYSLMYQFEYEFKEAPEFITFQQEIADANYIFPSEMRLSVKQSGTNVQYNEGIKPGKPHTVRFDWKSPALSEEATEKEWDEWVNRRREAVLGIESYSSVYSFIYLTDYEVRHEVLIPLATLSSIFEIKRRDEAFLDVDEQDAARDVIRDFFADGNPVEIDGVQVQPVFDRIDFYGLDLRDFAQQAAARRVSMASGRVGIIMSYSTKGTPNEVHVTWDKFSPAMLKVQSVVFAFENIEKIRFSRFANRNTWVWKNPGRPARPPITELAASLPPRSTLTVRPLAWGGVFAGLILFVVAFRRWGAPKAALAAGLLIAVVVGTSWSWAYEVDTPWSPPEPVSDDVATSVFETLHRNIYRAFDYGTESEVHDALAASVSGELLRDVYLGVRKSLEVREQGGAIARIREIKYVDGERLPNNQLDWPGFTYRSRWSVNGTVEHWGHIHERTNEFDAIFTVQLKDGTWRITAQDVTGERRVLARTRLRRPVAETFGGESAGDSDDTSENGGEDTSASEEPAS